MNKQPAQAHPISIKLPPDFKNRLNKLSKLKQRTSHWLMKEAIEQYLEQEEQAENFKKETKQRWKEVACNQVINHESVVDWLKSWGTDNERKAPL